MKNRRKLLCAAVWLSGLLCLWLPAQAAVTSVEEYRRQLQDLRARIGSLHEHPEYAGKVEAGIPERFTLQTDGGEIDIDYRSLKHDLAEYSAGNAAKKSALLPQIEAYVTALNDEADGFAKGTNSAAPMQGKLAEILARREFHRVHGPSGFDLLLARILRWFSRVLARISGVGARGISPVRLIIYALIGAALLLLAIWTIRRLRQGDEEPGQREIIPFAPSARGWRAWLGDARELAARQDWRNAIHMAYWAGISFLEEHGAWKPNRARTPREYLRLMNSRTAQYTPLAALTRKFEVTWYGRLEAAESDFQDTLSQLERLGCR